ncbi:MAG: hypothetical protein ACE5DK_10110 [Paracoccaceae bacterium]
MKQVYETERMRRMDPRTTATPADRADKETDFSPLDFEPLASPRLDWLQRLVEVALLFGFTVIGILFFL